MARNRSDLSSLGTQPSDERVRGLRPSDLIDLPGQERKIAQWMMSHSAEVSLSEVAANTKQDEGDALINLYELIERGYVQEIEVAGEPHYKIRLAPKEGIQLLPDAIQQALAPGSPLAVIPNPSGDHVVTAGSSFDLCVTVSNKGNQSALIDIFIDEVSPALRQWCDSPSDRLALGPKSSSEVIFQFQIPPQALPAIYNYFLVVDAPQHYPEDTPIRYSQRLQILPPIEEAVRVSDPTFTVVPATGSNSPAILQPGQVLQVTVGVHNRSDRVDSFWLTCPDLPENWFSVRYPEGLQEPGLVTTTDGLDLNPGAKGEILLLLNPPLNALAGSYFPTLRVQSANNPDLVLLDVVYLQVLPVYLLTVELRTLLGKVRRIAGLFEVRLNNAGNTVREIVLRARSLDEEELCTYTFVDEERAARQGEEPQSATHNSITAISQTVRSTALVSEFVGKAQIAPRKDAPLETQNSYWVRILPGTTATVPLQVKPNKWWRRPVFGGGRLINVGVELEDPQQLPLSNDLAQGTLVWEPRPWWQFLLLLLTGVCTVAAIAFLIWLLFFKPPAPPKIIEFNSENPSYKETDGDFIRLKWQIRNTDQIEQLKITGQSPDGTASVQPISYNFSRGIPNELKQFCRMQRVLICKNVLTEARQAGDYVFQLQVFSKKAKDVASDTAKTNTIKIQPIAPPKILEFSSTKPSYEVVKKDKIFLNWKLTNPDQIKELKLIGRAPDESVNSPLKRFDFSKDIAKGLKKYCTINDILTCTNVPTDAIQAGDYTFELTVIPKKGQGEPSDSKKTNPIKIKSKPPQILLFQINGKEALPKYLVQIDKEKPPVILSLSWRVEGDKDTKVELLPAPGVVPLQGAIPYPLAQKPGSETITLQVTNTAGEKIMRSFTLETIEVPPPPVPSPRPDAKASPLPNIVPASPVLPPPPPVPPPPSPGTAASPSPSPTGSPSPSPTGSPSPSPTGSPSPSPTGSPLPSSTGSPSPSDPDSLSPSELPPRFD